MSLLAAVWIGAGDAVAAPSGSAAIVAEKDNGHRQIDMTVWSPAMRAQMGLRVLAAPHDSSSAPTLYLLNGAAGGDAGSNWFDRTDIARFFADQNVNVVVPKGGAASYFTDWRHDDPRLGRLKWQTFLTQELPPLMDARLHGSGRNAIAGISMAGTSVFQLALAAPGLYRAVGSYSGCAQTSDPEGQAFVRLTVEARGGGNTVNMWGPPSDPEWRAKDPYVHAAEFAGTSIYVSNGSGLPGKYETLDGPGIDGNVGQLAEQVAAGAVIETATNNCAHNLQRRFAELGVPATFHFYSGGTHSWGYWNDELHRSWPQIKAALAG
ncbi:alpha/beta hydrolase [Williamsia sterculiae]|nr:alpha/beta hydrolase family protein [Williamsia sterculiae]